MRDAPGRWLVRLRRRARRATRITGNGRQRSGTFPVREVKDPTILVYLGDRTSEFSLSVHYWTANWILSARTYIWGERDLRGSDAPEADVEFARGISE